MKTHGGELLPLVTPGEVLREEFMVPLGLSGYRVAKDIGVSATAIGQIVAGARTLTADMAVRLGRYFGTTANFWMNLQVNHDLAKLVREGHDRHEITPYAEMEKVA